MQLEPQLRKHSSVGFVPKDWDQKRHKGRIEAWTRSSITDGDDDAMVNVKQRPGHVQHWQREYLGTWVGASASRAPLSQTNSLIRTVSAPPPPAQLYP